MIGAAGGFAAQGNGKGTPGTPWSGGVGITETVEQIMAREEGDDAKSHEHERRLRLHTGEHSQENPFAPFVPHWPIGTNSGPAPLLPQVTGVSFLGAQLSESSEVPPDSMGAVGPSQVAVIVNGRIKLFSKTGGSQSGLNTTTDALFASVRGANGTSDPHMRYDRLSGRWFIVMITIVKHSNSILIAMSSGPTITNGSSFTFFQFPQDFDGGDAGLFADYPTLGVDRFALYIGVNNFLSSTGGNATRTGFVVRKSSLLAGGPIVVTSFRNLDDDGQGNGTLQRSATARRRAWGGGAQ